MRRRSRWQVGWALALGLASACAGTRSEPPDRVAELEARVARLERLLGPEAGTVESDASALGMIEDAGSNAERAELAEAGRTNSDKLTECLTNAERSCRVRATQRRTESASGDAGLAWTRLDVPDDAAASSEGRKCLKAAEVSCLRQLRNDERQAALQTWLDAQLTSDRVDRVFSEKVRQRLDEKARRQERTEVLCTARFCRVRDPFDAGGGSAAWAVISSEARPDPGAESMRFNGANYEYITRGEYRFPN